MSHIHEFIIHQFRGLRDLKLEELSQVNLFVGRNNSGKTSTLEALSLYCDPLGWRTWLNTATMREMVGYNLETLVWLFPQEKDVKMEERTVVLSAVGTTPLKKVSARYEEFSEIVSDVKPGLPNGVIDKREQELPGIHIHATASEVGKEATKTITFSSHPLFSRSEEQELPTIPARFVCPYSYALGPLQRDIWSDVVKRNGKSEVIEMLQLFDPDIQAIDLISGEIPNSLWSSSPLVSVQHKKLGRAPLSIFGDGLRHAFTLASTMPSIRDGLLLIDELESALHTEALEKTFRWLVQSCIQNNVQLFTTTHSLEVLDTLLHATRDDIDLRVYRLQRENKHTVAKRFHKQIIVRLREELGVEVR
jgi:AAA domain, putative AbiEii toxin, Type IV TA system